MYLELKNLQRCFLFRCRTCCVVVSLTIEWMEAGVDYVDRSQFMWWAIECGKEYVDVRDDFMCLLCTTHVPKSFEHVWGHVDFARDWAGFRFSDYAAIFSLQLQRYLAMCTCVLLSTSCHTDRSNVVSRRLVIRVTHILLLCLATCHICCKSMNTTRRCLAYLHACIFMMRCLLASLALLIFQHEVGRHSERYTTRASNLQNKPIERCLKNRVSLSTCLPKSLHEDAKQFNGWLWEQIQRAWSPTGMLHGVTLQQLHSLVYTTLLGESNKALHLLPSLFDLLYTVRYASFAFAQRPYYCNFCAVPSGERVVPR